MELADQHAEDASGQVVDFGPFRLDPGARTLSSNGKPVAISSRAFDILQLLVELRGRVVTKDEIMDRVWPGMFVDENNLAVQISALRRILTVEDGGQQLIVTISGRGYRFVGPVTEAKAAIEASVAAEAPAATRPPAFITAITNLPWTVATGVIAAILIAALIVGYMSSSAIRSAFVAPGPQPDHATQAAPPRLSIAVASVPQSQRRSAAGLSGRRHRRRSDDRPISYSRQCRDRPLVGRHIQDAQCRGRADRQGTGCSLSA